MIAFSCVCMYTTVSGCITYVPMGVNLPLVLLTGSIVSNTNGRLTPIGT